MKNYSGYLCQGSNNGESMWFNSSGKPYFRNERDAHDVITIRHTGWFTDDMQSDMAIGIIASLPHNRFIAGYRLTMNDERVYYSEIFADEDDAARMSDEHARVIAESESEYQSKCSEAFELSELIEAKKEDVLQCKHDLEIAIAACCCTNVDSLTWMRAMKARKDARSDAASIIEDIHAFERDLEPLREYL